MSIKIILAALCSLTLASCGASDSKQNAADTESPFAVAISVIPATCSSHLATAGAVFQCSGKKFVTGIRDVSQPIGKFDSVTCCELRAGLFSVTPDFASYQVTSTAFGQDRTCSGHRFLKGVGFDAQGGAGTMHCYSLRAAGAPIYKSGAFAQIPFAAGGSVSCPGNQAADGLGDAIAPDGNIDSLHCRGGVRL